MPQGAAPRCPLPPTLLGPSGAVSYAVGFVAQNLQLQKKNRGFHWKPHLLINRTLPPHVARLQGASRLVATCPCLRGAT